MEKSKRLFAILLSVAMIVTYMPVMAFAAAEATDDPEEIVTEETQGVEGEATEEGETEEVTGSEAENTDPSEAVSDELTEEKEPAKEPEVEGPAKEPEAEKQAEEPSGTDGSDALALEKATIKGFTVKPDADLADSDTLLWDLLNKELAEETGKDTGSNRPLLRSKGVSRGEQLGLWSDRTLYYCLKEKIENMVDPDAIDPPSSTSIKITFSEIGCGYVTTGTDGATVIEVPVSDFELFYKDGKPMFHTSEIVSALIADMPYDLYWYDKKEGVTVGLDPENYSTDEVNYYFEDENAGICFDFFVSADYSATGQTGTTDLDPAKRERVNTAVATAAGIISNGPDDSYDRLEYYKDQICNRVSYDSSSANNSSTPYGDPWQMISVFDGNTSTNVVCEGYSKAFQYLCDNTPSEKLNGIECYSVTGTMRGGTGAGAHMWNLVRMDDARNYLVDITNCDSGAVGANSQLFLKGASDGDNDTGYTFICNDSDEVYYSYDAETKALFDDYELGLSWEDYEIFPPHEHPLIHVERKPATCMEKGVYEYWYCETCGTEFKDASGRRPNHANNVEPIDRYNHDWDEPVYEWEFTSERSARVTASMVCKRNAEHIYTETSNTTCEVLEQPTYEAEGLARLTAVFYKEGLETQTREVTLSRLYHGFGPIPDNDDEIPVITTDEMIDITDLADGQVHTYRYTSDTTDRLDARLEAYCNGTKIYGVFDINSTRVVTRESRIYPGSGGGKNWNTYSLTPDTTYYIQFKYNKEDMQSDSTFTDPENTRLYLRVGRADYSMGPIPDNPEKLVPDADTTVISAECYEVYTYVLDSSVKDYYKVSVVSDNADDSVTAIVFRAGKLKDNNTYHDIYITPETDGLYYLQIRRANGTENPGAAVLRVNYTTEHSKTTINAVAPTCVKDGNIEYKKCSHCNKLFDAEGNELTEDEIVRHAYGHKWTLTQNSIFDVSNYDRETNTGTVTAHFVCRNTPSLYEQASFSGTAVFTMVNAPTLASKGSGYFTATFPEVDGEYHTFKKDITLPEYDAKKAFWEPSADVIYGTIDDNKITDSTFYMDGSKLTLSYYSSYYIPEFTHTFYPVRYTNSDGTQSVEYFLDGDRGKDKLGTVETQIKNGENWDGTITEGDNTARLKVQFWGRTFYTDEFNLTGVTVEPHDPSHKLTHVAKKEPACGTAGNVEYWTCSICNRYFSDAAGENEIAKSNLIIPAESHEWGEVSYTPNKSKTYVTASRKCEKCGYRETRGAVLTLRIVNATCTTMGLKTYTSGSFGDTDIAAWRTTEYTPAIDHDWDEPAYFWSADNTQVTAYRTCKNDPYHQDTEVADANFEVTKEATAEETGIRTWTSEEFKNDAFTVQTKEEVIPKLVTVEEGSENAGTTLQTADDKIETANISSQEALDKAEALDGYSDETAINEAVDSLTQALTDAEAAVDAAQEAYDAAQAYYNAVQDAQGGMSGQSVSNGMLRATKSGAKSNTGDPLTDAEQMLAAAKYNKAAANNTLARSRKAAALIAMQQAYQAKAAAEEVDADPTASEEAKTEAAASANEAVANALDEAHKAEMTAFETGLLAASANDDTHLDEDRAANLAEVVSEAETIYDNAIGTIYEAEEIRKSADESVIIADAVSAAEAAKTKADETTSAVDTAVTAVSAYKTAADTAKTLADKAAKTMSKTDLAKAKKAVDSAKTKKAAAEKAVKDANGAVEEAESVLMDAAGKVDDAASIGNVMAARNILADADSEIEEFRTTLSTAGTSKTAADKVNTNATNAYNKANKAYLDWNGTVNSKIPTVKSPKITAGSKAVTVKWTKATAKNLKKFDKIEIQVCTDSKFAKKNTIRKEAKKTKTSLTVKKLKSKKYYWVRVRNVKGSGSAKKVSKWSKAKKIRVK